MKKTSPLWGSISILTGVVIAILSLLRGIWATVALLTAMGINAPSDDLSEDIPIKIGRASCRERV